MELAYLACGLGPVVQFIALARRWPAPSSTAVRLFKALVEKAPPKAKRAADYGLVTHRLADRYRVHASLGPVCRTCGKQCATVSSNPRLLICRECGWSYNR